MSNNLIANDILDWVSRVLIEPIVSTTLGTNVSPGSNTVTPPSMQAIYTGALLIVGSGSSQEIVTVTATTSTTFTATFANSHLSAEALFAATFPSGQPAMFLFTQAEMLNYLVNAQQDYLLKVRLLVTVATMAYSQSVRFYTHPTQAIRLERIARQTGADSTSGQPVYLDLFNTSAADLDMIVQNWTLDIGDPSNWYQDSVSTTTFGVYPNPAPGGTFELWYSDRGAASLALNSALSVPDIFTPALKYKVLEMCFSKDGEQRDTQRAKFCGENYKFWVMVGVKFMRGVMAVMEENQQRSGLQAAMTGG